MQEVRIEGLWVVGGIWLTKLGSVRSHGKERIKKERWEKGNIETEKRGRRER